MNHRPRLAFLGVGWIGKNRMDALAAAGAADIVAVADPDPDLRAAAAAAAPSARLVAGLDELLEVPSDGVVIATPSALHAAQAQAVLESGRHVFCQKPLGRTEAETRRTVEAARRRNLRLGVDFSYRHTAALTAVRELVRSGDLGQVFALDLTFHNAYGPDKAWFYDPALSGGGAVMDLGIHLVDAALWLLGFPEVTAVSSRLFARGTRLGPAPSVVEDYATAVLELDGGAEARLACSWRLPAGRDAIIAAHVYGTEGGAAFSNVNGSFYDFTAERYAGTSTRALVAPPDDWGGRALVDWARALAERPVFDPSIDEAVRVARTLDRIYQRTGLDAPLKMASNSAFRSL